MATKKPTARPPFSRAVLHLMAERGLAGTEMARRLGYRNAQSFYNLLSGGRFSAAKQEALAAALGITMEELAQAVLRQDQQPGADSGVVVSLPLVRRSHLSQLARAGDYESAVKGLPRYPLRRGTLSDYELARAALVEVEGRSMEPQLSPDDVVLCVRLVPGQLLSCVDRPLVVLMNSGEVCWKRLRAATDTGELRLTMDRTGEERRVPAAEVRSAWRILRLVERTIY